MNATVSYEGQARRQLGPAVLIIAAIVLLFVMIGAIWGEGWVDLLRGLFKLLVLFK